MVGRLPNYLWYINLISFAISILHNHFFTFCCCVELGFPFLFITGPQQIRRDNLIATKDVLSPSWRITFDLTARGVVADESSILHGTIGGDNGKVGERIPGIWFLPGVTKIKFCFAISGNGNSCYKTWRGFTINRTYKITLQQLLNHDDKKYYYKIFVGNFNIFTVVNTSPQVFQNVNFYSGDPWSPPAKATVANFKIETF